MVQQQQPTRQLFYALLLIFFLCARALESLKIMDYPSAVLYPTANLLPLCQGPGEHEDHGLLAVGGDPHIDQAVVGGGEW